MPPSSARSKRGHTIFDNIVKFVRSQLSTNVGAILTVLGAQLLSLPMPFTAIHILWINIIMDRPPAMTLGLEPARAGIMSVPPRRADERILTLARFKRLLMYGLTMTVGTLGLFHCAQGARRSLRADAGFHHLRFVSAVQCVQRPRRKFLYLQPTFFSNRKLWAALGAAVGLQTLVVKWTPAQIIFHTTALSAQDWGLAFAVASSILLLDECKKLIVKLLNY